MKLYEVEVVAKITIHGTSELEAKERHECLLKQLQNGERIWENDL